MSKSDKETSVFRLLLFAGRYALGFIALLTLIEGVKQYAGISLYRWGVFPQDLEGLPGVFFSPLIHSGWEHLWNNSGPLFILGTTLFWYHPNRALKIVGAIWLLEGLGVWLTGRPYFHVGASGLVYGLFAFIVAYGAMTRKKTHLGAAFLAVFLYGSMVWGIFPVRPEHSWEGHLWGFVVGAAIGIYYARKDLITIRFNELDNFNYYSESDVKDLDWEYTYTTKEEQ